MCTECNGTKNQYNFFNQTNIQSIKSLDLIIRSENAQRLFSSVRNFRMSNESIQW